MHAPHSSSIRFLLLLWFFLLLISFGLVQFVRRFFFAIVFVNHDVMLTAKSVFYSYWKNDLMQRNAWMLIAVFCIHNSIVIKFRLMHAFAQLFFKYVNFSATGAERMNNNVESGKINWILSQNDWNWESKNSRKSLRKLLIRFDVTVRKTPVLFDLLQGVDRPPEQNCTT